MPLRIESWTPEDELQGRIDTDALATSHEFATPYTEPQKEYGILETAKAFFMQENVAAAFLEQGFSPDQEDGLSYASPGFNPYAHYLANKDQFSDVDELVRRGHIDDVRNQEQFEARIANLRKEQERRTIAMDGPLTGQLLGMAGAIVDLDLLVPYAGWMSKGTRMARAVKGALYGGGIMAGQEAALHQFQDLRTTRESIMAIGIGSVLGGGIGALTKANMPNDTLHPRNPNNPFRMENHIPIADWVPGKSIKEAAQEAAERAKEAFSSKVTKGEGDNPNFGKDSAGAAKADADLHMVGHASKGRIGKTVDTAARWWAQSKFGTPSARAYRWTSQTMRNVSSRFLDIGGKMNTRETLGYANKVSAEDLKHHFYAMYEEMYQMHGQTLYELRTALGESDSGVAQALKQDARNVANFVSGGRVKGSGQFLDEVEFENLTRLALHDSLDDKTMADLASRWGETKAQMIGKAAKEQADRIHDLNKRLEDMMVEAGMITDKQRLGRNYRYAQLWDGGKIAHSEDEFRAFLYDVLEATPDADWLRTSFNLDLTDFQKLGNEPVKVPNASGAAETLEGAEAVKLKNEILDEWAGVNHERYLRRLGAEVAIAKSQYLQHRQLLISLAREFNRADHRFYQDAVGEARKIAKAKLQEVEALKARTKELRLKERELKEAATASRQKTLDRVIQKGDADVRIRTKGKQVVREGERIERSSDLAELEGKIAEITSQRKAIERKLRSLEPRVERLRVAATKASQSAALSKTRKKAFKDALREVRKDAPKVERAATRAAKRLAKGEKKLPLDQVVDDIIHQFKTNQHPSFGQLDDDFLAASGRTKRRTLKLSDEMRVFAEKKGWLRDDMYGVLERQYNDVSARLALRKTFGEEISDPKNSELVASVMDDYDRMIAVAKSQKEKAYLSAEKDKAISDIVGLRDRLLGVAGMPSDPDSWAFWLGQKAREFNFIRFGAGFLLTSLTDVGTVVLTNGFKYAFNPKYVKRTANILKGMSHDEIKTLVIATEKLMHGSRTFKVTNLDDVAMMAGIGHTGTAKHTITSNVDRALRGMAERVNTVSGLGWWNSRLKALTMVIQQDKLARMLQTGEYDTLLAKAHAGDLEAQNRVGQLATVGLGSEEMALVKRVMAKHPPVDDDGVLNLDVRKWVADGGAEGAEAYRLVTTALRRAASRAIMTPGIGDTPLLMSNSLGKLIMQFQTFGFTAVQRMVGPLSQRIRYYNDMDAYLGLALAASMGSFIVSAKDMLNWGEVRDRSADEWAYDIMDRSGMLAWTTPYLGAVKRVTGIGGGTTSRFAATNTVGMLLGPSFGLAGEVTGLGQATFDADLEQVQGKLLRLAPYSFYLRAANQLITDD